MATRYKYIPITPKQQKRMINNLKQIIMKPLKEYAKELVYCLFKLTNWNHFKLKAHNGKPYFKQIVKIKGFRTAVVDRYDGARSTNRFYWTIGKYHI